MSVKATTKKTTNKFTQNLAQSHNDIVEKRAVIIADAAERAQSRIVMDLKEKVAAINSEIMGYEDLNTDSTTSLNPVKGTFDAQSWATNLQKLKVDFAMAKEELSIAEETYEEFFGPLPV